jgi:hypothetical protein
MWKTHSYPADAIVATESKYVPESPLQPVKETQPQNLKPMGPQQVLGEFHKPSLPADIRAYTEAVNEFSRNTTAFIAQLPLLTTARDSYDRAMKISAEVRQILDTGEEELRTIMITLAQVLEEHVVRTEKKKTEPLESEATSVTNEV